MLWFFFVEAAIYQINVQPIIYYSEKLFYFYLHFLLIF